jgi:hypothetical protein
MNAIKTQNTMKHMIVFSSMLLFLLVFTKNTNSQEISGNSVESAGNSTELDVNAGTPNTILFRSITTQLEAELIANAPMTYEEGTMVGFSFPKEMFVELKVYDKSGKELKTLISETKNPGSYNTDLAMLDLKKGTYYYKLSIGSNVSVKKIILQY